MFIPEIKTAIAACLDANQPAWVWGKPGIGKSEAIAQVAQERGAAFVDIRLSMFDPVDLRGLPAAVDGETVWLRPGIWPKGDSGETIMLFDELDRASPAVLSAAMQIVLDRRIGEHALPDCVRIVAAGNGKTDRVGTNRIPAALANRFLHLDADADAGATRDHFTGKGIHPLLIAFLHFRPELVETDSQDGRTFATPRQWERVAAFLAQPDTIRPALVAGLVGATVAAEFEAFFQTFRALPSIPSILANPQGERIPAAHEPSALYGVSTALARAAKPDNFAAVLAYMARLPREFAVMTVSEAIKRDAALKSTSAFTAWAITNQGILI